MEIQPDEVEFVKKFLMRSMYSGHQSGAGPSLKYRDPGPLNQEVRSGAQASPFSK